MFAKTDETSWLKFSEHFKQWLSPTAMIKMSSHQLTFFPIYFCSGDLEYVSVRVGRKTGGEAVWSVNSVLGSFSAAEVLFPQCESPSACYHIWEADWHPDMGGGDYRGARAWCGPGHWMTFLFFFNLHHHLPLQWLNKHVMVVHIPGFIIADSMSKFHNFTLRLQILSVGEK